MIAQHLEHSITNHDRNGRMDTGQTASICHSPLSQKISSLTNPGLPASREVYRFDRDRLKKSETFIRDFRSFLPMMQTGNLSRVGINDFHFISRVYMGHIDSMESGDGEHRHL